MNENTRKCPFCNNAIIESGYLISKADAGPINFFGGFSAGIQSKLYWSKKKQGPYVNPIELKKSITAYKCKNCDTIFFTPNLNKSEFIIFSEWFKLLIIIPAAIIVIYLIVSMYVH